MIFFVFGSGSRTRRGSRPRSSNHCVCDGVCTHTHLHASASSCRAFPTPRVRAKRTLHENEQSGYLAKSVSNTGDEPREFDKNTSVDDTTPIIDPDHNISDFSKTASENTRQFGVSTVVESSVLHVSHWWFCSSERKQGKHAIGKPLQDREREREKERKGFVISVAESMSRKSRRNSIRSHSLQTHKEFTSDERDLRGHLERRAQQHILGENSVQSKCFSTEYDKILERRNSEYA